MDAGRTGTGPGRNRGRKRCKVVTFTANGKSKIDTVLINNTCWKTNKASENRGALGPDPGRPVRRGIAMWTKTAESV